MLIRKAEVEDAAGIAKVQVDSWRTTFKGIVPDDFLEGLSYDKREPIWKRAVMENNLYIAEDENGHVIGFSVGGKERTGNYEAFPGELYSIFILKEHQGTGIGRLLVKSVVDDLKKKKLFSMLIWVIEENPACQFYELLGGKKIGTREIEIGGKKLREIAYGWDDISDYK
ncbi:GNAT family N-acetyltransferase [Sporosarcina sp. E16_3]|nr:GNAT family N-acetyltransferase [Sporosarcina sp. E16_3]